MTFLHCHCPFYYVRSIIVTRFVTIPHVLIILTLVVILDSLAIALLSQERCRLSLLRQVLSGKVLIAILGSLVFGALCQRIVGIVAFFHFYDILLMVSIPSWRGHLAANLSDLEMIAVSIFTFSNKHLLFRGCVSMNASTSKSPEPWPYDLNFSWH